MSNGHESPESAQNSIAAFEYGEKERNYRIEFYQENSYPFLRRSEDLLSLFRKRGTVWHTKQLFVMLVRIRSSVKSLTVI
jgi:hypothetical protein